MQLVKNLQSDIYVTSETLVSVILLSNHKTASLAI